MANRREKEFLEAAQTDFPLVPRPYVALAKRFGLAEKEALGLLKRSRQNGLIRYVGVIFDMKKLGVVSTLVGMRVPGSKIAKTVRVINKYPQVTHNYERDGFYNVWFTLSASSQTQLGRLLSEIKRKTGIQDVLEASTVKVFKRRTVFEL